MSHFNAAVAYLSNPSSPSNLASTVKLELYGLFKYITVSPLPTASRPSIFDFTGRAKWDAWAAAGNAYKTKADAEERYLEIARSLGWSEGAVLAQPPRVETEAEEHDIWDSDDDENKPTKSSGDSGGFGNSVSAMARGEDEHDTSIHGLAVSNDLQGLGSLLQKDSSVDVNARDDFGYTPLHLASDRGHFSVVELLLDKGADRAIKDEDDLSAIELAQAAGHERIVQLLESSG
ncbi:ankyrin repeat-containing domain protein [Mycena maculata]|uniref:Ankyrin repeat-containing domain protein n=1 Tax=Mycena maculata TaxID=230809 RepID=A0AAD7KFM9_9AGAR|nr:ankyrin repeat-containing domain protein [Mycena maculata]